MVRQLVHQLDRRVGQVEDSGETPSVLDGSRDLQSLLQRLSLSLRKRQAPFLLLTLLVSRAWMNGDKEFQGTD